MSENEQYLHYLLEKTQTELASDKEAYRKSESRFREFFEIAPQAIALIQLHPMRFIKFNSNALQMLERSSDELFGMGPQDISPEYQPDGTCSGVKAREHIQQTLRGEKPVFEWQLKTGTGKLIYVEVRLILLCNYEEPLLYASFVDITQRRLMEERLREQNSRLAEIAYLQSHQVRQPVAHILGLINLLRCGSFPGPVNDDILCKIHSAASSFDTIIREIITRTQDIRQQIPAGPEAAAQYRLHL